MSDSTSLLRAAFPVEAIARGRSVYFRISDASRVLDYLRSQGWQVLGLEGFRTDQKGLKPDLGYIADLSSASDGIQAATRILDAWKVNAQLLVHFTVDDE